MADQEQSTDSGSKGFFSTLPGIITAVAGLITALGGFILILSKAGCMTPKSAVAIEQRAPQDSNIAKVETLPDTSTVSKENINGNNVSYSPTDIKVVLKNVVFKITSADVETLPGKEQVLTLKVKCRNDSKYEYHFYVYNMVVKIGDDKYAAEPGSPSDGYQAVPPNGTKNMEYYYNLPVSTKNFRLVISDDSKEMGSSAFTLK